MRCAHTADPRVPPAVESFLSHLPGRLGVIISVFPGPELLSVSIVDRDNIRRRPFDVCAATAPRVMQLFAPLLPRITFLGISTQSLPEVWQTFSELGSLEKFRIMLTRDYHSGEVFLPRVPEGCRVCPRLRTVEVFAHRAFGSTISADALCGMVGSLFAEETLSSAVLEVENGINVLGWMPYHDAIFAPPVARTLEEEMAAFTAEANLPLWAKF
ncbi:hypothetical protein AURDEDRAFT_112262 [Auricularia subglabra TFB-10046 SS5]|nr:hypothetical protein AURDEDRAFT_112262 [Auricularia subglabra TFB-10046 SS5]